MKTADSETPLESLLYGFVQSHSLILSPLIYSRGFFKFLSKSARSLLQVPVLMPMDLMVEASPRRIFANAHTYHINSISVNSDHETYLSADDLRINLWHLEITDRSFSILSLCQNTNIRYGAHTSGFCVVMKLKTACSLTVCSQIL